MPRLRIRVMTYRGGRGKMPYLRVRVMTYPEQAGQGCPAYEIGGVQASLQDWLTHSSAFPS